MDHDSIVGLDIAKSVFQVHRTDRSGAVLECRTLRRGAVLAYFAKLPPSLVGLEACASAHHWARSLAALGHEVRLIAPSYVKPYVRRQKNDVRDAAAIAEALMRPHMRFVPIKSVAQQSVLMLHRKSYRLVTVALANKMARIVWAVLRSGAPYRKAASI
ncbi:MAG: transposase [Alphaproteobacteria bacterium]|jgi:transposase|nr:transposase [Alphaproteobacteria bacterium]